MQTTQAKVLSEATRRKISQATALNDHTGVYVVVAELLGIDALTERAKAIQREHLRIWELTFDLYAKRHSLYVDLMKEAKQQFSATDYKRIYNAL